MFEDIIILILKGKVFVLSLLLVWIGLSMNEDESDIGIRGDIHDTGLNNGPIGGVKCEIEFGNAFGKECKDSSKT